LNFDTPRLFNFEFPDFRLLDEILSGDKHVRNLFFDEIQIVEGWEVYVRGKLDEGYKVVITGSNATLLSRELGTKLTGRYISKELFPFSYDEFCRYTSLQPGRESVMNYMETGGFPQYVLNGNPDILHALINDILYRDIAVRYNIRDDRSLKRLLMYMVTNIGNLVSANKLKHVIDVKSTTTVLEYLSFMQQSWLFHLLPKFSWSYKKQLVNPRKVYLIDNGLHDTINPSFTKDIGRKFENLIFWELRRITEDLFYYNENARECDFVVCNKNRPQLLIQVCTELHSDNFDRERNGLLDAMNYFDKSKGYIITLDQSDKISAGNKTIEVIPFYKADFRKMR